MITSENMCYKEKFTTRDRLLWDTMLATCQSQ